MLTFIQLLFLSRAALVAENLFLRKQLALFRERTARPKRTTLAFRTAMVALARFFNWREALVIVKPETFLKWHRAGFRSFWQWKSRKRGRPPLPRSLKKLIRTMARDNPTWGEERIADELSIKLGIQVSPRTVRKYLAVTPPSRALATSVGARSSETTPRRSLLAISLCRSRQRFKFSTSSWRWKSARQILHFNVTSHPTADWTTQQFREILANRRHYKFVIHDRDSIFSAALDASLKDFGAANQNASSGTKSQRLL